MDWGVIMTADELGNCTGGITAARLAAWNRTNTHAGGLFLLRRKNEPGRDRLDPVQPQQPDQLISLQFPFGSKIQRLIKSAFGLQFFLSAIEDDFFDNGTWQTRSKQTRGG